MDPTESLRSESPDVTRAKLMKRLVVAGLLIAILLGTLAVFDQLSEMEEAEVATPAAAAKDPAAAVGPSVRTDSSRPSVGAPPPPPIQPSIADAPKAEPPPAPEVSAQPANAAAPAVNLPVASARPPTATGRPAEPPPASVPEGTAGGPMQPAASTALPATAAAPVLPQLRRGYILQAGVFMSTERAEELKARLVMAGVPVSIESRVQVGPFATAREATAARAKIKALGIESIVIPPANSKAAGR